MTLNCNFDPLVSVYLTNYNYGLFIRQAIESVLVQTQQDFELIIIDDGSVDNSRSIIKEYAGHPKIKIIFQNNKGLNVTNNIALRAARGRYIMRLDADDWLDSHAVEMLSNKLERNPKIGLVFPDYYLANAEGDIIGQVRRHNFEDVTLLDQPAHGACTMIRTSCLREVGGYDESFSCQDGYDLWIRFIEHFEVCNINIPLFFYRQHSNNLTGNEERILSTRSEIVRRVVERRTTNLKVLAVIAVRGSSVDANSPALRVLGGKPLIDWTLDAGFHASRISKVVLSTPDAEIINHAKQLLNEKLLIVDRPVALANYNTSLGLTMRHALELAEADGSHYDAVFQLSIESPFRLARHLDAAIEVMELFDTNIVIGVRTETDNFYQHKGHGLVPINDDGRLRLEREEIFREVGSMRLLRRDHILSEKMFTEVKIGHIVLDQQAALRISSHFDWEVAERIMDNL